MANDFRETRDLAGGHTELFAEARNAVARCRWKVGASDAGSGVLTARTSWLALRGGGEQIEVRVVDGRVTCDSRSWSKLAVSDFGKNRANVERFFDALLDERLGRETDGPLDRVRSLTEILTERVAPQRAAWAPPSSAPTSSAPRSVLPTPVRVDQMPERADQIPLSADQIVVRDIRFAEPVLEAVSLDEIPVDNSKGRTELSIETEVRYTLRAGVSLDKTATIGGGIGLDIASLLTAKISAEGTTSRNVTQEQEITKSYKATFRAAPGENIVYRIAWKRRSYPGEVEFSDGSTTRSVPFQLVADLEYAVSTHLAER